MVTCVPQVWVITGDKQETAINIAISCKLILHPDSLLICNADSYDGAQWNWLLLCHHHMCCQLQQTRTDCCRSSLTALRICACAGARDRLHELLQIVQSRSGSQVRSLCRFCAVHYRVTCMSAAVSFAHQQESLKLCTVLQHRRSHTIADRDAVILTVLIAA